jgi:beta-glucosidase
MGAAWVQGLQTQGVGASLKHFAANNQETLRMTVSVDVDDRALHEIYLRAFAHVVKMADPWTVMCSYNRINGVYASQDEWLLTTILREHWGYGGVVVSDWGAVVDRVEALRAGLDLEMPGPSQGPSNLVDALRSGVIDETCVDRSVLRVMELAARASAMVPLESYDVDAHHALAREVATRSVVLLKNEGDLLPLDPTTHQTIAVIGEFARTPRFQGDGSSRVTPTKLDNALDAITATASGATIRFAPGFLIDGGDEEGAALHDEAVELARDADVVLAFLGLSAADESEGFDREHADVQPEQVALLRDLVAVNERVVLILSNGAMVTLAGWTDDVPAILETWLLGQAGGSATADVVFGLANPCGRLTETIPLRLADTPSYVNFPGDYDHVRYGEGIFVGYRYYDATDRDVSFPFGHGLSYSSFDYDNVEVTSDASGIRVTLDVRNTSSRDGREVVQVYVGALGSRVARAPKELRAFQSVPVAAQSSVSVALHVAREDLAYFDPLLQAWIVEGIDYRVFVASSSRVIRATHDVAIDGDTFDPPLSLMSTVGQWYVHPTGRAVLLEVLAAHLGGIDARSFPDPGTTVFKMMAGFRVKQLLDFMKMEVPQDELDAMVVAANGH